MNSLKLADEDRESFGGPELLDTRAAILRLNDLDYDALKAIEDEIRAEFGMVLIEFLADEIDTRSLAAFRGRAWLALRHAGVDIALADFKPNVFGMRSVRDTPDAGPPSGGAESSPESTTPAEPGPTSPASTEASAPGPGAPTE